ncbi:PQQ-binding-like beta-propeller repeat protein [Peribacillus frigoritolerans]|uniref:outer membrane protein assembly factor BamB family protein n=1 Tax=Peribacillus frigoritolerans TaxID=450367 RepID=UPI00207A8604|nr:RNA-binding domain-containing protein [Peribacillus frigoritolerans]USK82625.1 PQQ-binding-like beta-propeller repeat protein [Peribacillus frigoritolerans]
MDGNFFVELCKKPEGINIDFKRDQYKLNNDILKSNLIKDILSMANTIRNDDAYIIIGVKSYPNGVKEYIGVESHFDDSDIQNLIKDKVDKVPILHYIPVMFQGKSFAVIKISPSRYRPFLPIRDFGIVRKQCIYIRRGSMNDEARSEEIMELYKEKLLNDTPKLNTNSTSNLTVINSPTKNSISYPAENIIWAYNGDLETMTNSNYWNQSVFDNILYVGLKDTCVGLDIDNGNVVWKARATEIVGKPLKYNELIIVPSSGRISAWSSEKSSKWYHQNNTIWQCNSRSNISFYDYYNGTVLIITVKMSARADEPSQLYLMTGIESIDLTNGNSNWAFDTYDMGHSVPVILNEVVYFLTSLNIYALRLTDGSIIWQKQLNKTPSTNPFPLAVNEKYLVAGVWDPYNPEFFEMVCLNKDNGEKICVIELESQTHNFIHSNFALLDNKLVGTNDNEHIAVWDIINGQLIWESEETYQYPIFSLHKENLIVGYMGGVVKYSINDMTQIGHIEASEKKYITEPIVHNDKVFVSCTDGYVYALRF